MLRRHGSAPLLLVALALAACSPGADGSEVAENAGGRGRDRDASVGDGAQDVSAGDALFGDGGDTGPIVAIEVQPAHASLSIVDGKPTTQIFRAIATYQDQSQAEVAASWSFDRPDVALITPGGGLLTPTGMAGGVGNVIATFDGVTAQTDVAVDVVVHRNPAALAPAEQAAFATQDATSSGTLLYPYDGTVFPRGILPPDIMWDGGAAGDTYRVRLHEDHFDATLYVTADPPSGITVPADVWDALLASNAGEQVTVEVVRATAGQAHAPMTESWTVARGSLRGSIFYWAVNRGQIMKIAPGAAAPQEAFDSGASTDLGTPVPAGYWDAGTPPWDDNGTGRRCVACHTVSKDGSTIATAASSYQAKSRPWMTVDVATQTPKAIAPWNNNSINVALSPDGSLLVHNDQDTSVHLVDLATGGDVPSALDGLKKTAAPTFSPDAARLALVTGINGGWPIEYTGGDLTLFDFDAVGKSLSNQRVLVPSGGATLAYPSFSPDAQWVFYQKGSYSRAKYGATPPYQHATCKLWMADVATGTEIELSRASGVGQLDAKNQDLAYQPTVNPVAVGGYQWVVFVSPRDYGNRMRAVSDPSNENHKQLWVAAVDLAPQPGTDPSHPAFLLGGQDRATTNMSGYWTLEPCKQAGSSCNEGYECCTGFCRADGDGGTSCVAPPGGCSQLGEACTAAGDCCGAAGGAVRCIGGVCAQGNPG